MQRYNAMTNLLAQPDSHAMGVMKLLNETYPALAKKVFEGNPLMEKAVMSGFINMDILNHPVCGKCEALALWCYAKDDNGVYKKGKDGKGIIACTCWKCGAQSELPIKFIDWCLMELNKRASPDIGIDLIFAVDMIAERARQDAKRIYISAFEKEKDYVESDE